MTENGRDPASWIRAGSGLTAGALIVRSRNLESGFPA